MNVNDMQVQDEDDRHDEQSRSKTITANNKIMKERIWTLNSPFRQRTSKVVKERIRINQFTSKIVVQPLESDTDAQLHKERVISVRKAAKFASRVATREMSQVKWGHSGNFLSM